MKLLEDPWIPVGNRRTIALQTLLTEDGGWQLSLPRDDMELACLQLLVCLVQTLFAPSDRAALRQRLKTPLTPEEYRTGIDGKESWFDLAHPEHPFMQTLGVKSKELTEMAKLFAGLTSSTSSVFVNEPGLADNLCPSCAAIGLFNQANNAPSFGGGFKGSLRGGAPITTLVLEDDLRRRIWRNVLPEDRLAKLMPWHPETREQKPNWIAPVKAGEVFQFNQLGLLRGLFWQPAHIELAMSEQGGHCASCGKTGETLYAGFKKEKFVYEMKGVWPHPHSPRYWDLKKGEKLEKFASFTTIASAWTQLTSFIVEAADKKSGHIPAPTVSQFRDMSDIDTPLHMIVGGYRNNQAAILERRHEFFDLAKGWTDDDGTVKRIVDEGIGYLKALRGKLYGLSKKSGLNLHDAADKLFYRRTESIIHDLLREIDFSQVDAAFNRYHRQLSNISLEIFDQMVEPYQETPSLIKPVAIARRSLMKACKTLREG